MPDLGLIYSYFHVEVHVYHLFWVDKSYILVRMEGLILVWDTNHVLPTGSVVTRVKFEYQE